MGQPEALDSSETLLTQTLDVALRDVFGARFDLWQWTDSWTKLSPRDQTTPEALSSDASGLLAGLSAILSRRNAEAQVVSADGGRSFLAIPLRPDGGRLVVATSFFTRSELDLLRRLGRLFAREFAERKKLQEYEAEVESCQRQISQNLEHLCFLNNLAENSAISEFMLDEWALAQSALPLITHLIQAEAVTLLPALPDVQNEQSAEVRAGTPFIWVGPRHIDEDTCCQLVEEYRGAAEVQPVIKNRFAETREGRTFPNVRDFILVPIVKAELVLGWILALNRIHLRDHLPTAMNDYRAGFRLSDFEFGTVEANLLTSMAANIATYARNICLVRERDALFVNMIRALVSAIEAKDAYTSGHSERVALVSRHLGADLGLSDQECERLYLTGLLHDVGKIGISDAVLRKPGKLTPDEFDEIKRHPTVGCTILQGLVQLSYVLPGVRHHHEKLDGTGYPCRLVGEKIPFHARILAVADAYDAMSSHRPYRQGMPPEQVEETLRSGAGTQWDPRVVDALFRILPQIRILCESTTPSAAALALPATLPATAWNPNTDRVEPVFDDTNMAAI